MTGRRAPCTFRQTDVTRALKAARRAGFERVRVEIDQDGKVVAIVAGERVDKPEVASNNLNPLDQWMQKHAHETQGD
jgi:hypothetical protein